jgi:hypothetical protein
MFAAAFHPLPEQNPKQKHRRLRLSQVIESFCYWLTMAGLAIATVYLGYLTVSHAPPPDPAELGWCASTPRWMVDCLPLFVTGICLGEAGYSFWKGIRSWKEISVGAGFLLLRGLAQWLPPLAALPHH